MLRLFTFIAERLRPKFHLGHNLRGERAVCLKAYDAALHARATHPAFSPAASRGLSPTA